MDQGTRIIFRLAVSDPAHSGPRVERADHLIKEAALDHEPAGTKSHNHNVSAGCVAERLGVREGSEGRGMKEV